MKYLLLMILLAGLAHSQATYPAASCAPADIQTALNNEASGTLTGGQCVDGDIIQIPGGATCNANDNQWTGSKPLVQWAQKCTVNVQGAGAITQQFNTITKANNPGSYITVQSVGIPGPGTGFNVGDIVQTSNNTGVLYSGNVVAINPSACISPCIQVAPATLNVIAVNTNIYDQYGTDSTNLIDNMTYNVADNGMVTITTAAGKCFTWSGTEFSRSAIHDSTITSGGVLRINGLSQCIRVTGNHFNWIHDQSLTIGGWQYGVVDHNLFNFHKTQVTVRDPSYNGGTDGTGNPSWADSAHWGSNQFVFLENNYFDGNENPVDGGGGSNDCDHGGRTVVRYNTFINAALQGHNGAGNSQGCRAEEIYNNTAFGTTQNNSSFFYYRTGSALVFNNTTTGYDVFVSAHNDRSENNNSQFPTPPFNYGRCGTTAPYTSIVNTNGTTVTWVSGSTFGGLGEVWPVNFGVMINGITYLTSTVTNPNSTTLTLSFSAGTQNGVTMTQAPSAWDQNTDSTGWRCMQQLGSGKGDLISGNFPNAINSAATIGGLATIQLASGGTGCSVNDVLTVGNGNGDGKILVTAVNSGVATKVSVATSGNNYPISSGIPTTNFTGSGTCNGVTINLTGVAAYPRNAFEPIMVWNNSYIVPRNQGCSYFGMGKTDALVIKENRDFYLNLPNACEPSAINCAGQAACTQGIGSGTLAQMPTQCTPIVGYWATDVNTLYQCDFLNTWVAYYTPYVYPHPLVQTNPPTSLAMFPVTVSWTQSNTSGITANNIYRGTASGTETLYYSCTTPCTSYIDTNVTHGSTYFYQTTAIANGMESKKSAEIQINVP